jgi:hypothetical protein
MANTFGPRVLLPPLLPHLKAGLESSDVSPLRLSVHELFCSC